MNKWRWGIAVVMLTLGCTAEQGDRELGLGVELANLDLAVRPQDDFFQHVNGTWLENTQIPADKSNYGSFTLLADEAEANIRAIIEEAAADDDLAQGSDGQKIGDFYTSFMNEAAVEERGLQPLAAAFARIDRIATHADVVEYFGYSQTARVQSPIGFFVGQDAKNSEQYISYIGQSGLGMPDRDYYFKPDERFVQIRAAYVEHIERMLAMAEISDPAGSARAIMDLETRIAEHRWTRVQNRDRDSTYNKVDLAGASDLAPRLGWHTFLTAADVGDMEEFVVRQPSYLQALDGLILDTSVDDWKTYSNWKLIRRWAGNLPRRFVDENFDFYQRTLKGYGGCPASLEAWREHRAGRARRNAGKRLRGTPLPDRKEGPDGRIGGQSSTGIRNIDRRTRVDG